MDISSNSEKKGQTTPIDLSKSATQTTTSTATKLPTLKLSIKNLQNPQISNSSVIHFLSSVFNQILLPPIGTINNR